MYRGVDCIVGLVCYHEILHKCNSALVRAKCMCLLLLAFVTLRKQFGE